MNRLGTWTTMLLMIGAVAISTALSSSRRQEPSTISTQRTEPAVVTARAPSLGAQTQGATPAPTAYTDDEEAKKEKNLGYNLEKADTSPKITEAVALKVAKDQLGLDDKPLTNPKASHWLATKQRKPRDDGKPKKEHLDLEKQAVWIVTYDEVETSGPVPVGSPISPNYTGRFDIMVDSITGAWLMTGITETKP